jgi:hypothetical protein
MPAMVSIESDIEIPVFPDVLTFLKAGAGVWGGDAYEQWADIDKGGNGVFGDFEAEA